MTTINNINVDGQIAIDIKKIFDDNQLNDLKKFMNKRQSLNYWNSNLIYLFYIIQSSGILITSIAASTNDKILLWIGVSLNMTASLIQIFEKINNSLLKKLMNDIQSIKDGTYIDESALIDTDKDLNLHNSKKNEDKYKKNEEECKV